MKQTSENLNECDFIHQIDEKRISRTAGLIYEIGNRPTSERVMPSLHNQARPRQTRLDEHENE